VARLHLTQLCFKHTIHCWTRPWKNLVMLSITYLIEIVEPYFYYINTILFDCNISCWNSYTNKIHNLLIRHSVMTVFRFDRILGGAICWFLNIQAISVPDLKHTYRGTYNYAFPRFSKQSGRQCEIKQKPCTVRG